MSPKRYYWMSYHAPKDKEKKLPPHLVRDGAAFAELSAIFHSLGYKYGGLLLNPPAEESEDDESFDRHHPVRFGKAADWSFVTSSDVLILSTRPPLDDKSQGDRKYVARSYTWLECQVFLALDSFFGTCARSRIELGKQFAGRLRNGFESRYDIKFHQYPWAWYKECRRADRRKYEPASEEPLTTAGYLLHARICTSEWPNGPRLVGAFGMGGTETLVWAHLLRLNEKRSGRIRALLARPERNDLLMGEMTTSTPPPDNHFRDISFAKDWQVQMVLKPVKKSEKSAKPIDEQLQSFGPKRLWA